MIQKERYVKNNNPICKCSNRKNTNRITMETAITCLWAFAFCGKRVRGGGGLCRDDGVEACQCILELQPTVNNNDLLISPAEKLTFFQEGYLGNRERKMPLICCGWWERGRRPVVNIARTRTCAHTQAHSLSYTHAHTHTVYTHMYKPVGETHELTLLHCNQFQYAAVSRRQHCEI